MSGMALKTVTMLKQGAREFHEKTSFCFTRILDIMKTTEHEIHSPVIHSLLQDIVDRLVLFEAYSEEVKQLGCRLLLWYLF